jgi:hypothetical protein
MEHAQTPLKLYYSEWVHIRNQLKDQHGMKGILNSVLKRESGWTYRSRQFMDDVDIDFWDDGAKSMFLLTYSHFIPKSLKMQKKMRG